MREPAPRRRPAPSTPRLPHRRRRRREEEGARTAREGGGPPNPTREGGGAPVSGEKGLERRGDEGEGHDSSQEMEVTRMEPLGFRLGEEVE